MANFLYTPKSGSKITMFPDYFKKLDNSNFTKKSENDSEMKLKGSGIVIIRHNNESYHILNAADICTYSAEPNEYFRDEARALTQSLAYEYNGVSYDDCGSVGVFVPQEYATLCYVAMLFVEPSPNYAVLDLYGIDKRKFFSLLNGIDAIPSNRETSEVKTGLILSATKMLQKELVEIPERNFDTLYVSKNDYSLKFIMDINFQGNFIDRITFPQSWGEPDIWIWS